MLFRYESRHERSRRRIVGDNASENVPPVLMDPGRETRTVSEVIVNYPLSGPRAVRSLDLAHVADVQFIWINVEDLCRDRTQHKGRGVVAGLDSATPGERV